MADPAIDFDVLFEDRSFLVLNKSSGILSQSTYGVDSVVFQVRRWLQSRDATAAEPFAELPHRLDRGTSGILLVALNRRALRDLSEQFHTRKIEKSYLVAVSGTPPVHEEWKDSMRKIPEMAKGEIVNADHEDARLARLSHSQVWSNGRNSVHRVQLLTGRMHQIRLQFAHRGFPVLGDALYGSKETWSQEKLHQHDERFALHAEWIALRSPHDAQRLEFRAPLPAIWLERLPELRIALQMNP